VRRLLPFLGGLRLDFQICLLVRSQVRTLSPSVGAALAMWAELNPHCAILWTPIPLNS
jgi:hypothetical protein